MTTVTDSLRALRHSTAFALSELAAVYSLTSWLAGWVLRVVGQVVFYALIGVLLDDEAAVRFLIVGNVGLMAAANVMLAIPSTQWERYAGTLPLLVASPSRVGLVFMGRSVEWIADAVATSVIALFVVVPLFGVPLSLAKTFALVPLLLLIAASTYGLATFLGALVLRKPDVRNVVSNLTIGVMAVITGANVRVEFFPEPLQWLAQLFPLTHGLEAMRALAGSGSAGAVAAAAARGALVGGLWLVLAVTSFEWFAESGRKDGSIEFGD